MTTCNCTDESVVKSVLGKLRLGSDFLPCGDNADSSELETVCKKVLGCIRITAEYCCSGETEGGGDDGPLDLKKYKIVMPFKGSLDNKGTETISTSNMLGTASYDPDRGMSGAGFVVNFSSFAWGGSNNPWTLSVWWNDSVEGPNCVFANIEANHLGTGFHCWSNASGLNAYYNGTVSMYTPRGGLKHLVLDSQGNKYLNGDFIGSIEEGNGDLSGSTLNVFSDGINRYECGFISNLILHDKVLSAERIKEIYELGSTPYNL